MLGKASSFRRAFIVLRCPYQEFRVDAAEALNLSPFQPFDPNLGFNVKEDDKVKGIFHLITPVDDRARNDGTFLRLHISNKGRQALRPISLASERRDRWKPVVIVGFEMCDSQLCSKCCAECRCARTGSASDVDKHT